MKKQLFKKGDKVPFNTNLFFDYNIILIKDGGKTIIQKQGFNVVRGTKNAYVNQGGQHENW